MGRKTRIEQKNSRKSRGDEIDCADKLV